MKYYIGIDDTDTLESRGTGHLARVIAEVLSQDFNIHGVTRHQLLDDERVPMTAKNSCACIVFEGDDYPLSEIALYARKIMLDDFQPGSDPGLCVSKDVPDEVIKFGYRVKNELVKQDDARNLARKTGMYLEGLGGDENGVIGALAAVGLFVQGNDGRYVLVGSIRELEGLQPVSRVKKAGVAEVLTSKGFHVAAGQIQTEKMRPARRAHQPILFVKPENNYWLPLKFD